MKRSACTRACSFVGRGSGFYLEASIIAQVALCLTRKERDSKSVIAKPRGSSRSVTPSTPHHSPKSPPPAGSRSRQPVPVSEPVSTPWSRIPPAAASCWDACRAPLLAWFDVHARDLPWRAPSGSGSQTRGSGPPELEAGLDPRRPPYAVWISEIMLQQTVVAAVIPHFERWMRTFPDVQALASAEPEQVLQAWAGLGYYARARNLHQGAKAVVKRGAWPEDVVAWREIPGVGEYTAGAVASLAFGLRAPILDGNVVRVFSRLLGLNFLPGAGAAEKRVYWELARLWVGSIGAGDGGAGQKLGDADRPGALNEALMELGALVCIPAAPRCDACPLAAWCTARANGWTDVLPPPKPRAPVERVAAVAVIAKAHGAVMTEVRGRGAFLAGHRMFPFFLGEDATTWREAFARRYPAWRLQGPESGPPALLATFSHAIMSKRYDVDVWSAALHPVTPPTTPKHSAKDVPVQTWVPENEVEAILTNALAKKIWKAGETRNPG